MEFLIIISIISGLIFGSFLNCLIFRLHAKKTMGGRSACPACSQKIAWYDNIPVISFIILRARCRSCRKAISWQYPLVEFITAVLFVCATMFEFSRGGDLMLLIARDWIFIFALIAIFIYDLRWYIIPDVISLPASLIVLILNLWIGFDWRFLILSGIIGAGFFLLQFVISRGRWIGGGDIRMGLLMGVGLGWPGIAIALFVSYLLGSIGGLGLIALGKKKMGSQIPFGVFLSLGAVITLFYGEAILSWYLFLYV